MNEMSMFCPECGKYVPSHMVQKQETLNIKGVPITIDEHVRMCDECGNELFDMELEKAIEKEAFDAYRSKKNH